MLRKTLGALALSLSVLGAGLAHADAPYSPNFALATVLPTSDHIELKDVVSPANGRIEVFDFRLGRMGDRLGVTEVGPGVQDHVVVNLNRAPEGHVVAVLWNGDEVIGVQSFRVDPDLH